MARYWVYLNDEVAGPYTVEQLIRLRTFSRQTQVCVDDASGKPTNWMSPAEIPELAHIFKAAHEQLVAPSAPATKPSPKPAPVRAPRTYSPAVTLKAPSRNTPSTWIWIAVTAALLSGGAWKWSQWVRRGDQAREQAAAKTLVEGVRLPSGSLYATLRQYIDEKRLTPRWEVEQSQDPLYQVTVSWYAPAAAGAPSLSVYAFEANVQAQTVRALNTAASKLLSEGFPAPPAPSAPAAKKAPIVKESPEKLFPAALDNRREALENGDFSAVWDSFSARKRSEMSRAGISREGFIRVQGLTHRVDSAQKQNVLKTLPQSDTEMLALIKQTQPDRPDIFVKQLWVYEQGAWKLDDEEKRSAQPAETPKSEVPSPPAAQASPKSDAPPVSPAALPGMSH